MNDNKMTVKKLADALAISLIVLILFALFGVTGIFSDLGASLSGKTGKTEITAFSQSEISDLEIEVATADITLIKGSELQIEHDRFGFTLKEKNGKISLEERGGIFALNRNRKVIITVPDSFTFNKAEIETGASDISGESLKADQLEIDIGSGKVELDNLEVYSKAKIDCGAGEFTVGDGAITNLKFSLGVGKTTINTVLSSDCDFECGVGELKLNLQDGKDAYAFDIETGIGAVRLDSQRVRSNTLIGNGQNKINIEGGVGSIDITFNPN